MKKLSYLIVLVLILGLALTGCTLLSNVGQVPTTGQSGISYLTKGGTTEAEAEEVVLYAGQYENVGVVKVWNDTENLYVKYIVDDPWCLTETHLHVAAVPEDIPQTKKGNPIPGQFDYEGEHDCETYVLYTIPLAGLDVELCIAAHAVVADTSITTEDVVVSRLGIDVYGPLSVDTNLGDPLWGLASPAVAAWEHPLWLSLISIPGATWISTSEYVEDPVNNSWRWFHDEINIQGYPLAGSVVLATADNAEEVYFNEESVGSNGNWTVLTEYSIEPQPGLNTLDFIVRNYAQAGGSAASNPTGLIYKATISYYPEESAWAGKMPLPGDNWATCFTYIVQPVLVDTVEVFANKIDITYSNVILGNGKNYKLKVSGTAFAGDTIDFDAKYSITNRIAGDGWTDLVSGYESCGPDLLELSVEGAFVNWGEYNDGHIYYWDMVGDGSPLGLALWIYDICYPNNSGSLIVNIYWMP